MPILQPAKNSKTQLNKHRHKQFSNGQVWFSFASKALPNDEDSSQVKGLLASAINIDIQGSHKNKLARCSLYGCRKKKAKGNEELEAQV